MAGQWKSRLASLCLLGILAAAGCGPPAAFYVETTIHPDGSCDRMIWQPKDKFLPDGALSRNGMRFGSPFRMRAVDPERLVPGLPKTSASISLRVAHLAVRGRSLRTITLPIKKSPTQGRVSSRGPTTGRTMVRRRTPLAGEDHEHRDLAWFLESSGRVARPVSTGLHRSDRKGIWSGL